LNAPAGGEVVELYPENVDSYLGSGKVMVEMYAPWCPYCKELEPVWEDFAGKLKAGRRKAQRDARR
jgi:thiol-disulfide isomerase/thioredoxin